MRGSRVAQTLPMLVERPAGPQHSELQTAVQAAASCSSDSSGPSPPALTGKTSGMPADEAFVTLVTSDSYCQGAVVVARSLRRHGTTRRIVVMVTPNVSEQCRFSLHADFDEVFLVDPIHSENQHTPPSPWRCSELSLTKIQCWTLTQFKKCVFVEADTLVLCNVDELFQREELSAAPDPTWPDCFNSGVFVFKPSLHTHSRLLQHANQHAMQHGGVDEGDQDVLNSFFCSWSEENIHRRLPFLYNLISSSAYSYLPAFHQFGHHAKIVHFTGAVKPWNGQNEDSSTDTMGRFYSLWWKEHLCRSTEKQPNRRAEKQQIPERRAEVPVRECLDICSSLLPHFTSPPQNLDSEPGPTPPTESTQLLEEAGCSERPADPSPTAEAAGDGAAPQEAAEPQELQHRRRWETGQADYLGRDAFQNIQKMLDRFLD